MKWKRINFNFFSSSKVLPKEKTIFRLPAKRLEYNKELNAVGIDLGTSECCAFVIRRHGPDGVVLDPTTSKRILPSYIAIDELNGPCGQYVVNRLETRPEFLAFDAKRLIGKEFNEIVINPLWPYKVIN
uniref:Heat shock protein 70 n=1 Tax=Panagrolaimus davidi TaxID=227884 RepID=A0A914PG79_9BILA